MFEDNKSLVNRPLLYGIKRTTLPLLENGPYVSSGNVTKCPTAVLMICFVQILTKDRNGKNDPTWRISGKKGKMVLDSPILQMQRISNLTVHN